MYEFGRLERQRIMSDVKVPKEDDAREVIVSLEESAAIIDACDPEFRRLVAVAMLTGIDRSPLLRLEVRHLDEAGGEVQVPDRKTSSRPKRLALAPEALHFLRLSVAGKGPTDRIFPFTKWQVRKRWDAVGKKWAEGTQPGSGTDAHPHLPVRERGAGHRDRLDFCLRCR